MLPAIFLDRDGVIIENRPNYVRSWDDVIFFPQALQALALIRDSQYKIVIVTNQSAVGRGILALEEAEIINKRLVTAIEAAGGRVDGVFMCPHAPGDSCACRKPRPGLLFQAAEALSLDLRYSMMIGDTWNDLLAGQAARVPRLALVRTGLGANETMLLRPSTLRAALIFDTLADAIAGLDKL